MTAWSHLPNATHIDRVLASSKAHPEAWEAAWEKAWGAGWRAARDRACEALTAQARGAAWDQAWDAARGSAARDAVAALIAYDNSAKFLDMTSKELKLWRVLSEDPACILLLPAVQAFEKIKELTLVDS